MTPALLQPTAKQPGWRGRPNLGLGTAVPSAFQAPCSTVGALTQPGLLAAPRLCPDPVRSACPGVLTPRARLLLCRKARPLC